MASLLHFVQLILLLRRALVSPCSENRANRTQHGRGSRETVSLVLVSTTCVALDEAQRQLHCPEQGVTA